ncbi:MAG: SpoIIIAH-like family protein [Thermaerobacterales bacterium]
MSVSKSPLRFVLFLLLAALLFSYIVTKWTDFNQQTYTGERETQLPDVITGTLTESGKTGDGPRQQERLTEGEGSDLPAATDPGHGYSLFADGRIERDQSRSRRLESLEGMLDNANISSDIRSKAEEELLLLSQRITQEADVENLIRARGFEDAVVFLYPEAAVVIVRNDHLEQAQVAQLADLVLKVAGIPFEGISVMARPH